MMNEAYHFVCLAIVNCKSNILMVATMNSNKKESKICYSKMMAS